MLPPQPLGIIACIAYVESSKPDMREGHIMGEHAIRKVTW